MVFSLERAENPDEARRDVAFLNQAGFNQAGLDPAGFDQAGPGVKPMFQAIASGATLTLGSFGPARLCSIGAGGGDLAFGGHDGLLFRNRERVLSKSAGN
jgi:hypothetical protein